MARMQGLTLARGNRGLLIVAALAGLAAAVLFVVAVNQDSGNSSAGTGGGTAKTVVADQSIAAGVEVKEDMVRVRDVAEDLLVVGAYSDTLPVVGEVTKVAIAEGEQITPSKIGPLFETQGADGIVPKGMRAIALRVDESTAVGGLLLPGNRVDVIAVFGADHPLLELFGATQGSEAPSVAITVLQNVEILSVAQTSQEALRAGDSDKDGDGTRDVVTSGQVPEDVETQPGASTLTLAVDPAQAQLLAVVQEEAREVYTTLRGFGDEAPVELPPVDISTVRPR